jgi:hypothetical protein
MSDLLLAQDPVLAEIVNRLVEAYQPERISSSARKHAATPRPTVITTCSSSRLTMRRPRDATASWHTRRSGALEHPSMPSSAAAVGFTPALT